MEEKTIYRVEDYRTEEEHFIKISEEEYQIINWFLGIMNLLDDINFYEKNDLTIEEFNVVN